MKRNAADPIYNVPNLYASVEYLTNNKECKISCMGDDVTICIGDKKYYYALKVDRNEKLEAEGYVPGKNIKREERIALLKDSFYTIVTNYSLQAFNSYDYMSDGCRNYVAGPGTFGIHSSGDWVSSIFNKNDGYLVPLAFNPYRDKGKFDLQGETERTISRLSAILVQAKQKNKQVLEGYQLEDIHYEYDEYAVGEKFISTCPRKTQHEMSVRKKNCI